MTPANLPEPAFLILGYGAVCLGFGMLVGHLLGQSIVDRIVSLFRRS